MLGDKIRAARKEKGMLQKDLAGDDISRAYVSALETGRVNPSAEKLLILSERLGKPIAYFLSDLGKQAEPMLTALLKQSETDISRGRIEKAESILHGCEALVNACGSPRLEGLYHEEAALLMSKRGQILQSVRCSLVAAQNYLQSGLRLDAWYCRYMAAYSLQLGGHLNDAIDIGQSALQVVRGQPGFTKQERRTAQLLGAAYLAQGKTEVAQRYFDLALGEGESHDEVSIYALLGSAACASMQENWSAMLQLSRKAEFIASNRRMVDLVVESMIAAMCSLLQLGRISEARQVLYESLQTEGMSEPLKRKVCREFLLIMSDRGEAEDTMREEERLKNLLEEASPSDESWELLKDLWAMEKCRLCRSPSDAKNTVERHASALAARGRRKDAAEVMVFGARLLERQGKFDDAFQLMNAAFDLAGRN